MRGRNLLNWLDVLLRDVHFGLRVLGRNLTFSIAAIFTLALGIGANTAIFSVADWLVFRPLAVTNPKQIVYVTAQQKGTNDWNNAFSYPEFEDVRREGVQVFSAVAGDQSNQLVGFTVNGRTHPIWTDFVTNNFFQVLGLIPTVGDFFVTSEANLSEPDSAVVLGESFWRGQLGGDPDIVGKTGFINGRSVTVVGIGPKNFRGLSSWMNTQAYVPIGLAPQVLGLKSDFRTDFATQSLLLIARLQPALRPEAAQPLLDSIASRWSLQRPQPDRERVLRALPLGPSGPSGDPVADPVPKIAGLFLLLAAFVLVLACINVANLILVRGNARQREMAIRSALGADRGRLVRQLLTESLLISFFGGVTGVFVGAIATSVLSSIHLGPTAPIVISPRIDWRVFAFSFTIALLTGIAVGFVPALRASRQTLTDVMHKDHLSRTTGKQNLRRVIVPLQVAASLSVLVVAGLFARSLIYVQTVGLGFDPHNVTNLSFDPSEIGYNENEGVSFYEELVQRVRNLPNVQSASLASLVPMGNEVDGDDVLVPGYQAPESSNPHAHYNCVSPDYFKTMHISLLRGRDFSESDTKNSLRVIIVNQAMADRFWPNQDAIGKQFSMASDPQRSLTIIGVVANSRNYDFAGPFDSYFYMPFRQHYGPSQILQVRTDLPFGRAATDIASVARSLEPAMPVFNVQTMTDALRSINGTLPLRVGAALTVSLGALGLVLAVVGVYGVVSYAEALRKREIGIRMALGAEPSNILVMILRHALLIVAIGLGGGIAAAFVLSRQFADFLVGVSPGDPLIYTSVSLLLAGCVMVASFIPAWRATRIDPMISLRHE